MCQKSVKITPNAWCGANFAADICHLSCRHFSWQAQSFARVGGVEVECLWVHREVATLGGGECRCNSEIGVSAGFEGLGLRNCLGGAA